jgi:hypothetical protein
MRSKSKHKLHFCLTERLQKTILYSILRHLSFDCNTLQEIRYGISHLWHHVHTAKISHFVFFDYRFSTGISPIYELKNWSSERWNYCLAQIPWDNKYVIQDHLSFAPSSNISYTHALTCSRTTNTLPPPLFSSTAIPCSPCSVYTFHLTYSSGRGPYKLNF